MPLRLNTHDFSGLLPPPGGRRTRRTLRWREAKRSLLRRAGRRLLRWCLLRLSCSGGPLLRQLLFLLILFLLKIIFVVIRNLPTSQPTDSRGSTITHGGLLSSLSRSFLCWSLFRGSSFLASGCWLLGCRLFLLIRISIGLCTAGNIHVHHGGVGVVIPRARPSLALQPQLSAMDVRL